MIFFRSMGEVAQALAVVPAMSKDFDNAATESVAAEVYFAQGDDVAAALLARKALVLMTRTKRAASDGIGGLGPHGRRVARWSSRPGSRGVQGLSGRGPKAKTVDQVKALLQPSRVAPGCDAFWEALKSAGLEG